MARLTNHPSKTISFPSCKIPIDFTGASAHKLIVPLHLDAKFSALGLTHMSMCQSPNKGCVSPLAEHNGIC